MCWKPLRCLAICTRTSKCWFTDQFCWHCEMKILFYHWPSVQCSSWPVSTLYSHGTIDIRHGAITVRKKTSIIHCNLFSLLEGSVAMDREKPSGEDIDVEDHISTSWRRRITNNICQGVKHKEYVAVCVRGKVTWGLHRHRGMKFWYLLWRVVRTGFCLQLYPVRSNEVSDIASFVGEGHQTQSMFMILINCSEDHMQYPF